MNIAGLGLSEHQTNDHLQQILASALGERLGKQVLPDTLSDALYWDAKFFNLEQVSIFQDASLEEKREILHHANRGLMEEAYFIEKAGMGYMAKMVLLAETTEERMLYSLFAADETLHLSQLRPFFCQEPVVVNDPFLNLLAEIIAHADKTLLLFVLQVVLEGWGLTHYQYLSKGCCHSLLAALFHGFLRAEAQNHATGVSLFKQVKLSQATQSELVEVLQTFLQMIRVGPQRIVAAIAQVKGDLSRSQKILILEQLNTEYHSGTRLKLLRSLMHKAGATLIVEQLEQRNLFQPLPAHQCAL